MAAAFHIAQFNIARAFEPLDHPSMAEFAAQIDAVNRQAEAAPGFVWRLASEGGGGSGYILVDNDPRLLINMSVWESIESLREWAYSGQHLDVFRARRRWFEAPSGPSVVLWWVPAGHRPTIEEGRARLALLAANGPAPEAFTFKQAFPAPVGVATASE